MSSRTETGLSPVELRQRIDAARGGSRSAIGMLLGGCLDYLLFVANRELDANLRAKVSPSDVVQETFAEAHRDFAGFVGNSEKELLAWLRRILLNNAFSARRKYRGTASRNINLEISLNDSDVVVGGAWLLSDTATPSKHAVLTEQLLAVEQVLAKLPADYQLVLRLRYWERLRLTEIARQMERTPDAIQKLWFRAIERFKRELKEDGEP